MQINELDSAYGEGLSWLLELNLIQNPAVANAIVLNIFKVSNRIKDAEILTDTDHKRMLVWIELDWLGKKFFTKEITKNIEKMLQSALPSYQFRVVTDKTLFQKAINLMRPKKDTNDQKNTKNSA